MSDENKRSYLIGLIFSVICPGLGHIYSGKLKLGLFIFLLITTLSAIHFTGVLNSSATTYILFVGIIVLAMTATIIHCLLTIKKNRTISLNSYNKWYVYLLAFIVSTTINLFIPKSYETFHIPSEAMAPTLQIGDYVYAEYDFEVNRGDIIVFKYPNDPAINYVKRVIAMPGDEVEIINKVVYVNNNPISTTSLQINNIENLVSEKFHKYNFQLLESETFKSKHKILLDKDNSNMTNFEKVTVPKDNYFVLGDNRDFSADSRIWGFVPKENLIARPKFIYFSKKLERFGVQVQ